MNGDLVFMSSDGDFASITTSVCLRHSYDDEDINEILSQMELEVIESPRKMLTLDENNERVIAFPITPLVKRGIKHAVSHEMFENRQDYDKFLDEINSRNNDYILFNKHGGDFL